MVNMQLPKILAVPHVELITIFNDKENALNGVKFDAQKQQLLALPIKGHFADLVNNNKLITLPDDNQSKEISRNFTFSGAE